jgi:PAS domain S-box-containing protein
MLRTNGWDVERLTTNESAHVIVILKGSTKMTIDNAGIDVTDRNRAEESWRMAAAALEAISEGIVVADAEIKIQHVNPAFTQMTGYSASETVGRTLRLLESGRHDAAFYQRIETAMHGQGEWRGEIWHRRKDGEIYPQFMVINAINGGNGQTIGYVAILADITEQKQAREALRQARDAALEASRLKSEFLANMSHEIRTPMNGILGMTELALRTALTVEQRSYLTLAKSSGEALLEIINDVLDFSKIEAGHLELEQAPLLLRETIGSAIKPLALRAHQKGLELSCHIMPEVPEALIGDPVRLRQIVANLVGNALKFTEHGEVVLRIDLERQGPAGDSTSNRGSRICSLHCSVSDTGIGISPEKQRLIFQPFVQADGSTTREYGGTGLGLTICARLVERMGGRIWIESQPGKGSTFHFTVQFELQDDDGGREGMGVLTLEGLAGLSVLGVDDSATSRTILEEWLTCWQMQPTMAASAGAALAILGRTKGSGRPFNLFILDAEMPEMDGFSLAATIQQQGEERVPTILMLNSIDQPGDIARCRDLGVSTYVVKPVTPSELWDAMMMALGKEGLVTKVAAKIEQGQNGEGSPIPVTGRRRRILLAEDNPVNQLLAVRLLEKEGHSVSVAGTGLQALAALEQEPFDLILMDVQMPEMDGFEATAAIRTLEQVSGRHIPIVALTAHAIKGDRDRCLEAGMDEYLSKPLQAEALFSMIARIMKEKLPCGS